MERRYSGITLIALVLLTASVTLFFSILVFRPFHGVEGNLRTELERFQEVREIISRHYVGDFEEAALTDAALAATVSALRDPWSHFLSAEQYESHLRAVGNQQQGIGLVFNRDEETNEILVVGTTSGSPAEAAGLAAGDTIVEMEGRCTADMGTAEIRRMIGDNFGGTIVMEVRNEAGEMRTAIVEVQDFFVSPVSFEMMEGDIGYIQIDNFDVGSGNETIAAIEALLEDGAQGLIFDVRGNPGGRVVELLQILDRLLPEGEIFVFQDAAGNESVRYSGPDYYLDIPMVVLVNGFSSSAAEFFAAILQEQDWATIVGTGTTGKGRSQVLIPLDGGGAILLSTSRYLTPGRVDLYEIGGIQPDVWVENQADGEDRQLDEAWEILALRTLQPRV